MYKSIINARSFLFTSVLLMSHSAIATNNAFNIFDSNNGWNEADYTHGPLTSSGNPDGKIATSGGQAFDTEYLFFKYNDSDDTLSIGLQTGFDLSDGKQYSSPSYYAGDLALSFGDLGQSSVINGNSSTYEYAVDFGFFTRDGDGEKVDAGNGPYNGKDYAGLYEVDQWNNEIWTGASSPFAMDEGTKISGALTQNDWGYGNTSDNSNYNSYSYYRIVTFKLDDIENLGENFTVDAHWTMSCGNDEINGKYEIVRNSGGGNPVPEPSAMALMAIGSLSLGFAGYRRRKFNF